MHSGNLKDWWDAKTEKEFLSKTKCIIWQYGNYSADEVGLNLNGINTQGENIADNGGIKSAYRAYRNETSVPLPLRCVIHAIMHAIMHACIVACVICIITLMSSL